MSDLAAALALGGHRIIVLTSDRGYDDTSVTFAKCERLANGVEVRRLSHTSFGKATLLHRAAAIASFALQANIVTALTRRLDGVVFSTSPPFIGIAATLVGAVRGVRTAFWAMDLNPDQLIVLGKLASNGLIARTLRRLNRFMLRRASVVITLDALMAARLVEQGANADTLLITPPWSPDDTLEAIPRERNGFRAAHGLNESTVVMYSGNHTPSNPLTTLLAAAVALHDVPHLKFVFVGNGTAKLDVEEVSRRHALNNVLSLPYQPKSMLAESLSAADVHVVALGSAMAGVIHPCKVYGAMAVGRPILYFGPAPSHVASIIEECGNGWQVRHGDVEGAVKILRMIANTRHADLDCTGRRGQAMLDARFRPAVLSGRVSAAIERAFAASRDA